MGNKLFIQHDLLEKILINAKQINRLYSTGNVTRAVTKLSVNLKTTHTSHLF